MKQKNPNSKTVLKILDTFSGAGGFSLGFHLAGQKIIGAIEIDKWAAETFAENHREAKMMIGDIRHFDNEHIKELFGNDKPNLILGGPPCQGFSISNRKSGDPSDPRNSLFIEFLRAGKIFEPDYMILENVPNIVKAKTQHGDFVVNIINHELRNMGYHVYHKTLEATDYGVPQIRRRFFVLASSHPLEQPFPAPTHNVFHGEENLFGSDLDQCPCLWDSISDLPDIEACEGGEEMDYDKPAYNSYQNMMRQGSDRVFNHAAMKHSERMIRRFASMSWGDSASDVPEYLRPYRRNGKGIISKKVYDQNNRRMHPDKPCHTVPASFYANFVHPYRNRNFTAREGARIQSFPDWFVFKGKPTVVSHKLLQREGRINEKYLCQYNQIGNAVPPLMAKALAENLIRNTEAA